MNMISTKYKMVSINIFLYSIICSYFELFQFSNQLTEQVLYYFLKKRGFSLNLTAAKLFTNTLNLPRLPVPQLSQTIDKYIKTVTPFLSEDELKNTKNLLNEFKSENGIGEKLQKLLLQKANNEENWLADWWLKNAYLSYRDPVVVFSSPGLVFPFEDFENEYQRLEYTASLILGAVKNKIAIYR